MDEIRKEFERLHPVPELTIFGDICYVSQSSSEHMQQMTEDYNGLYQGFRSGYAAGMERAALIADDWHPATASVIRAAKEQK